MNLQPVTGTPFGFNCVCCGRRFNTSKTKTWADLDGEAFKAYYCDDCATNKITDARFTKDWERCQIND